MAASRIPTSDASSRHPLVNSRHSHGSGTTYAGGALQRKSWYRGARLSRARIAEMSDLTFSLSRAIGGHEEAYILAIVPTPSDRLEAALAGRYRSERELGAGGMATVHLAHDLKHERDVALKMLRPELGAVLGAERFLAEIKITARLDHPHVFTLIDSGAVDGLL